MLLVPLLAGAAAAQTTGSPGDSEAGPRDQAMSLFDRGRRQIEDGDVRGGLGSCEQAYGIYPTPAALARLGACYEWASRTDDAVDAYRRAWSSSSADESVREFAASAIERLTGTRPVAPVTPPGGGHDQQTPQPRTPPPGPSHVWPWAFTVGALALAAGAGATGAWTYTLWSDLDSEATQLRATRALHGPPYDEPDYAATYSDIQDRNPTLQLVSTIALSIGAAALVAGTIALILWLTSD